mmetsp:Transcript_51220/g.124808  ORF Transcript_51220/g.124808 Transcript_51220/m.124808 type:complete len:266 (-) Transcript_51220:476-1273(-)
MITQLVGSTIAAEMIHKIRRETAVALVHDTVQAEEKAEAFPNILSGRPVFYAPVFRSDLFHDPIEFASKESDELEQGLSRVQQQPFPSLRSVGQRHKSFEQQDLGIFCKFQLRQQARQAPKNTGQALDVIKLCQESRDEALRVEQERQEVDGLFVSLLDAPDEGRHQALELAVLDKYLTDGIELIFIKNVPVHDGVPEFNGNLLNSTSQRKVGPRIADEHLDRLSKEILYVAVRNQERTEGLVVIPELVADVVVQQCDEVGQRCD